MHECDALVKGNISVRSVRFPKVCEGDTLQHGVSTNDTCNEVTFINFIGLDKKLIFSLLGLFIKLGLNFVRYRHKFV
jgi:hypothetical protein